MASALLQKTPYGSFGGQPGGTLDKYKNKDQSPSVMDKEELPLTAEELARSLAERDAIGPPTVGLVSIDPTDWLTPGGLAKVAAVLKGVLAPAAAVSTAMLVGSRAAGPTSQLARTLPRQTGAILQGGRPDLNVLHGTSDATILKLANDVVDTGKSVLHAPSFEISTIPEGRAGFGSGDATIIPKPHAVDPKNRPDAHLYNRDAYVSRSGGKPYTKEELEYIINDPALTESFALPPLGHSLSLFASPKFQSFAEYEASPIGAAILNKGRKDTSHLKLYEMGISRNILEDAMNSKKGLVSLYAEISKRANSGDKIAKGYLGRLQRQGSEYAELKLVRDLEINKDNIAAILFNPGGFTTKEEKELMRYMLGQDLGIPTGTVQDFLPSGARQKMNAFMSDNIKAYKKVIEETSNNLGIPDMKFLDKETIRKMNSSLVSQLPEGAKPPKYTRDPLSDIVFMANEDPVGITRDGLRNFYEEAMRGPHYIETVNEITKEAVKK